MASVSRPRTPAGTTARARAASGLRLEIRLATTRERGRLEALNAREVSGRTEGSMPSQRHKSVSVAWGSAMKSSNL